MPDLDVDCCVVGAGFAGLTAALRLQQAGLTVAVLEARDRVGGRTWTEVLDDGTVIDRGGAWVGPGQDAIYGLAAEVGVGTYEQHTEGQNLMVVNGKPNRYDGVVPWTLNPWVSANLGLAMAWLEKRSKEIPLDAPWWAEDARDLDAQSLGSWMARSKNIPSGTARQLLGMAMRGIYTSDPSEVSLLYALFQLGSGGGPSFFLGVKDAAEDERIEGGMGAIYEAVARRLGDAVHLSQPVARIAQDGGGATVEAATTSVRAGRVVVAVPITIAGQITYEPQLPPDRHQLHQRVPQGAVFKVAAVYDEPFWRADGLTGESSDHRSPVTMTIDACTASGDPGILNAFVTAGHARAHTVLAPHERRAIVLEALVERFGPKAARPERYIEQNWTTERWTGGGMIAHLPPGVLTEFGPALREPCGRIHWAGTETSSVMVGSVDGAVRSGERAAAEVVALAG